MPFLRRRGNMASDSDMRRQSTLVDESADASLHPDQIAAAHHQGKNSLDQPRLSESTVASASSSTSRPPSNPTIQEPPTLEFSRSADQPGTAMASLHENGAEDDLSSRPDTPPVQEETPKHKRFSILRFRNASDSQLSIKAKQQAEKPPPVPRPPQIITTAPTMPAPPDPAPQRKPSRMRLADRFRKSSDMPRNSEESRPIRPQPTKKHSWGRRTTGLEDLAAARSRPPLVTFEENQRDPGTSPSPSDKESATAGPTPNNNSNSNNGSGSNIRMSESSRSDASSVHHGQGDATTPTKTSGGGSSGGGGAAHFFRLPRRKNKAPPPLFDLSHLPQKGKGIVAASGSNSNVSHSNKTSHENKVRPQNLSRPGSGYSTRADSVNSASAADQHPKPSVSPATALFRPGSTHSGHSSPTRSRLQLRGRSSTMSSMGRDSIDEHLQPNTTRTSTSTGRKSLGDMLSLNRLRQNTDLNHSGRQGTLTPATPASGTSKNNSLQIAREPITLPERQEDETAAKYLARIEPSLSRGVIASALSKPTDPFFATVLRSYMRRFSFFGDPMDMAIRKLLMEAELPKETQQIDRFLQAFANRYHECNPGIFSSPDQAYFIAFSLLILHTDVFNKNNKYKMQQTDYIKNTQGEGVSEPILKCFYDNITYTPFIHVEDDVDLYGNRERTKRKPIFPGGTPEVINKKSSKEPLDPYTIILDSRLDLLRPSLKDVMELEDHYNYLGTAKEFHLQELRRTFFRTGVLQIVSARSRPDAFREENSTTNPDTAPQGVVDIKVTKVGLLWRKDTKKKRTRSPWQEWGAILTGAQLYFFRNTAWVKSLMHQYDHHVKQGYYGEPITFKPPLTDFKPDAFMPIKDAVALVDTTYKRHKNAFKYSRPSAYVEEVLLADNEEEMNDWLAKLNYAAAFTTSGVRMRGLIGGNYEGQSRRGIRRLDSSSSAQVFQTPSGEVTVVRGQIDHREAESILQQRHETMGNAVAQAQEDMAAKEKELEVDLRNARHLQILAPIQQRSRDELLREAARMDVRIKWIRMNMWKIKCHRDVLAKDLEEEGVTALLSPSKAQNREAVDASPRRPSTCGTDAGHSAMSSRRRSSSAAPTLPPQAQTPTASPAPDVVSPVAEEYQTPPASATLPGHRHKQSADSTQSFGETLGRHRSASYATTSSVIHVTPNPARLEVPSTPEKQQDTNGSKDAEQKHSDDVDAQERNLLEQAGLLGSPSRHTTGRDRHGSVSEADTSEHRDSSTTTTDKADRTKVRRSLQRTLRESAGHLSHHRSRRGKEPANTAISDDNVRDDMLNRGTGSFMVHGKKASVITFGEGLQHMPTEERLRQKLQSAVRDEPLSPSSTEEDFHDAPTTMQEPPHDTRERRESIASGSTATARSFRELHRRYSSAQGHKPHSHTGKLSVPSDTESEAAASISEGRRSPLPPIEHEAGEEDEEPGALLPGQSRPQLVHSASSGDLPVSPLTRDPGGVKMDDEDTEEEQVEQDANPRADPKQRLSSPHLQSVRA